jgi:chromosomal replication initiation ATPase DnaA
MSKTKPLTIYEENEHLWRSLTDRQKKLSRLCKEVACEHWGITMDQMDGTMKPAYIIRARHSAMWILIHLFHWRVQDCRAPFDVSHGSIMNARDKINPIWEGKCEMKIAPLHREDLVEYVNKVKQKAKEHELTGR